MSIISTPISRKELLSIAKERFGDMVKGVVDCKRKVMALGGELHADEEQLLLESGSLQEDVWGINLYPENATNEWIEFDSMINLRPSQNNQSRGVESPALQEQIRTIVHALVLP